MGVNRSDTTKVTPRNDHLPHACGGEPAKDMKGYTMRLNLPHACGGEPQLLDHFDGCICKHLPHACGGEPRNMFRRTSSR